MPKYALMGMQHKEQRALSTVVLLAQLFVDTVRSAIVAVRPTAPFVDSSPSNGVYSTDPYSKRCGPCMAWESARVTMSGSLRCASAENRV